MKAIVVKSPNEKEPVSLADRPSPSPRGGQVVVRIKSAGVGIWDPMFMRGEIPDFKSTYPLVPGWEGAGVISAIGDGVARFKIGDEVYFFDYPEKEFGGAWAEEAVVPEHCVGLKPERISMEEAGGLPGIALTPYQAFRKAFKLERGQSILICNGAGGVGTCAIQIAKLMGARVIALSSARNHALLKDLGADHVFDYHEDFGPLLRKFFSEGVDHVFDNIGARETVAKAISCLKSGGTFITIVESFEDLQRKDVRNEFFGVEPSGEDLEALGKLVDEGKLRVVLDQVFPLERFREAIERVESRHVHGKVVLKVA